MIDIQRKYTISDASLLEFALKVADNLQNDLLKFYIFDDSLSSSTPFEIENTIEVVQKLKQNTAIIDEIPQISNRISDVIGKCDIICNKLTLAFSNYFIDNSLVQNQLYYNNIDRYDQTQMLEFMSSLNDIAKTYKHELIESGIDPLLLKALSALYNELLEINTMETVINKVYNCFVQENIKKMNELYDLIAPIGAIARIIYADNPEKIDKYALPFQRVTAKDLDNFIVSLAHSSVSK